MHRMLDMYGALPYSQISSDKLSTPYDTMEEAYHAMFTDLTDAINVMTVYVTENPNNRTMAKYDKVYDGDFEKWVKFANSLKLRMLPFVFVLQIVNMPDRWRRKLLTIL
ncbi:SusD/RagB family nutrient-binding outer membrane lipoprotein [Bacteroides ovatus]|nr:SusD/RagB family nutrient-binding outer membrane lipoprotein [Bacteroides ovatus]